MKLPLKCDVNYYSDFLSEELAWELYNLLLEEYKIDQAQIIIEAGGRIVKTDSFKILFMTQELADAETHPEHIHGKNHIWSGLMAQLRQNVEQFTGKTYELAMAIWYPDGNYFAPYHNDQMTSNKETVLPSLSLGTVREFTFRENETQEVYSLELAHGSLLVMGKNCQENYQHSLLKSPKYTNGRINITFREPNFQ